MTAITVATYAAAVLAVLHAGRVCGLEGTFPLPPCNSTSCPAFRWNASAPNQIGSFSIISSKRNGTNNTYTSVTFYVNRTASVEEVTIDCYDINGVVKMNASANSSYISSSNVNGFTVNLTSSWNAITVAKINDTNQCSFSMNLSYVRPESWNNTIALTEGYLDITDASKPVKISNASYQSTMNVLTMLFSPLSTPPTTPLATTPLTTVRPTNASATTGARSDGIRINQGFVQPLVGLIAAVTFKAFNM